MHCTGPLLLLWLHHCLASLRTFRATRGVLFICDRTGLVQGTGLIVVRKNGGNHQQNKGDAKKHFCLFACAPVEECLQSMSVPLVILAAKKNTIFNDASCRPGDNQKLRLTPFQLTVQWKLVVFDQSRKRKNYLDKVAKEIQRCLLCLRLAGYSFCLTEMGSVHGVVATLAMIHLVAASKICRVVDSQDVICNSTGSLVDLKVEFASLETDENNLRNLFIYNIPLVKIEAGLFANLTFESVIINSAEELESADWSAFNGSTLRNQLLINAPTKLASTSVMEMPCTLSKLIQVEVSLSDNHHHRLYNCTTSDDIELNYLTFIPNHYTLASIEDYAFNHLVELETIKLANNPIQSIQDNAFFIASLSKQNLIVNLDNCSLNNSMFDSTIRVSNQRPTILMLGKLK